LTPPLDAAKAYREVRRNGQWLPARKVNEEHDLATAFGDDAVQGPRSLILLGP
jgi:hypothetical protein